MVTHVKRLFETFVENSDPWGSGLTPNPENHSIWIWGPDICGLKKKNCRFVVVVVVVVLKTLKIIPAGSDFIFFTLWW